MKIYLHSLVFIVFLASIVHADLLHRYSFTNGDATAVDSVGGKHGTLQGGATISGNAVQLNGTGAYVNLPSNLISGLTALTFEVWFTCAVDSGTWSRVWDFGDTNSSTGAGRDYVFFTPKSGSNTSRYAISDADPGYSHENIVETVLTATGVPVYVAVTHNSTNGAVKLYVNGQLASSGTFSIPLSSVNNVFSYLGRSLYPDPPLKGAIDEFRIYNSVLDDQQILNSYESGPDPYRAINPNPASGSTGVPVSTGLSWSPPSGGTPDSYTVYISDEPNFIGGQIIEVPDGNSCSPALDNDTTCYWRVDTHFGVTTYTGVVWTFTTCALAMDRSPIGDINRDFEVNLLDLQLIANDWLADENSPANLIDLGGNEGIGVDNADYAEFAKNWQVSASKLVINEFMADNKNYLADPCGSYDDWIEIYNCSNATVDLSGMYLTDNLDNPDKWRIPDGVTIAPQGYLLFWADEEEIQGNNHTNFKLDSSGEEIGLFDTNGSTLIDSVVFDDQYPDMSYGRYPDSGLVWRLFDAPTPRACNCQGYLGVVAEPDFNVDRGFYEQPFQVRIETDTEGAIIRYTLDGSSPTESYGTIYDPNSPVQITKTTIVRALAYKPDYKSSSVNTHTYIFLENVINQPASPPGFPTSWAPLPDSADYEMDPRVVYDPNYYPTIKNDLLTIPSVCIGIDNNDFFGAAEGVYSNGLVRDLEKPASMEFIDPITGETYQANIGLRSHGGVGRKDRKHSLRILAKSQYGPAKLEFPFFKDTEVEKFDSIVLRATWNYSWIGDGTQAQAQYNRDTFSRDTVRDMGRLTPYGRHVHLYINGLYWGLYKFVERPDDGFAEEHLGGDKTDYDVIKTNAQYWTGPDVIELLAGDLQTWDTMFALAEQDLSNPQNYEAILQYLDIPAMIDYLLMIFYTGERDAPVLLGNDQAPRNFYAIRKRQPGAGFVFIPWDCEWCLEGTAVNRVNIDGYENPHHLYQRLLANSEFRILLIDKIQQRFFNNGVLTPQVSINRYLTRLADVDRAIIGESARWGDSDRPSQPYTRNVEWVTERNRLVNEYFPVRTGIVIGQLRSTGMFPSFDAPVFNINGSPKYGGQVNAGDLLTMTASTGMIYYTLDGNDPRLPGGAVNPNASIFTSGSSQPITLIAESVAKKIFVPSSDIGITWKGGSEPFDDSTWTHGTFISGKTGGVGYDKESAYLPYISYDVNSWMFDIMASCYIRIPFSISSEDLAKLNSLTLNVRCDDGFVGYINGQEVANINKPEPLLWNSTCENRPDSVDFVAFDITDKIHTLQAGINILAMHAMNQSTTSSDFLCSIELKGTVSTSDPIVLTETTKVKARVLSSGQWSALSDAIFAVGNVAENLRITEIMYHPQDTNDPNDPNEEFIELKNIGTETLNLNLVRFTRGISFTFPDVELAGGEYILVVKDHDAIETRYGLDPNFNPDKIAGQYSGSLDNAGERIVLEDAIGQIIHNFRYQDDWFDITDGGGFSLTMRDPCNPDPNVWGDKSGWRTSAYIGGSPGWDDSGEMPDRGTIVINELLAHSDVAPNDWIELHNTTGETINIGGWFLSDNDSNLTKYEIAEGTTIGPYGYFVFYEDLNFGNPGDLGCHIPFALSENGETVYLHAGRNGQLMGEMDVEEFDASEVGIAFGRYRKSTGTYNFVAMSENTPWLPNAYPKVGPIVINEIMYHPNDVSADAEYVELLNISGSSVTLQEYDNEQYIYVPWRFTDSGGISFDFPLGTTMVNGEHLLLVKDIDAFNSAGYPAVPGGVKIFEWVDGRLDNAGEKIQLSKPGDEDPVTHQRYYIRVDRVNYDDTAPWPTEPDGSGKSLNRLFPHYYGNDPNNWKAGPPSPGLANP